MRTFAEAYPQYPFVQVPLASSQNQFVQVPLAQITWYHQIYHRAFVVFLQEQCKSRIRYAGARQTIDNVFSEGELVKDVVVAKFATTTLHGAIKGKTQNVEYYNLDVIISVGYREKSKQGTQFRIWATNVLRDYLLKGYAKNQRINRIENQVENLSEKKMQFHCKFNLVEFQIKAYFSTDKYLMLTNWLLKLFAPHRKVLC